MELTQAKSKIAKYRAPKRGKGIKVSEIVTFLVPLLLFVVLLYGTLLWTIYVSLTDWKNVSPNYDLTGFKWYEFLVQQPRFGIDIKNNLLWLVLGVVPTIAIAIFLAYFLEMTPFPKIEAYLRTLILYPVAMSFIVTGTIWSWMYEPGRGVLNSILRTMGFDANFRYTTDPNTATYWLILIFVWQYLGFSVIILQSSLRTSDLYEMIEAATLDGASRMRILFAIVIPNIRGGILVLVSLLLISTLKVFDIVYIVTFGGPGSSTDVLALNMWVTTFQQQLVSAGAGLGMIIFLLAFIVVIPYTIYAFRKWFE